MLVGGLVAYGAHKMSTKDADRIKEHTGVDPEELEDTELEQAMTELSIEKQAVTAAIWNSVAPAATSDTASTPPGDYIEELQQLAALRDQGILTDDEFDKKKAQILGLG
jgi:anion-transporting  ArsA/GET3 family ATPase